MRIASPDTLAYEALDELAAIPQRNGVPLPALLAPYRFVGSAGFALAALGALRTGEHSFVLIWGLLALGHGINELKDYQRLRSDVAAWSPEKAQEYRALAVINRERYAWMRTTALVVGVVAMAVTLMNLPILPSYLIPFGFMVALVGFVGNMYSQCLMPRDPDLRQPAPLPT